MNSALPVFGKAINTNAMPAATAVLNRRGVSDSKSKRVIPLRYDNCSSRQLSESAPLAASASAYRAARSHLNAPPSHSAAWPFAAVEVGVRHPPPQPPRAVRYTASSTARPGTSSRRHRRALPHAIGAAAKPNATRGRSASGTPAPDHQGSEPKSPHSARLAHQGSSPHSSPGADRSASG